ncbi:MAG: class I SAM-dependent rRNA methyltransferase, partial [Spirochaetaceae bacterium]|nr:class I SAM-dependent rRNA methyltransferase [Spirochaetaceae bacterium]
MNGFPRIFLKPREEGPVRSGFPWVFDNEIDSSRTCSCADGDACEVFSASGLFAGTGIYNGASKIRVRILTGRRGDSLFAPYAPGGLDYLHTEQSAAFFREAVDRALALRRISFSESESCRLVFGEADLIPGLIADRFVDVQGRVFLVIQFLSLSCEVFREEILGALTAAVKPWGVFERSDGEVRLKEGLPKQSRWLGEGRESPVVIRENGLRFYVDIRGGQKTGYYLDQKRNRAVAGGLAKGRRVFDGFCHTGAFGLNAALGGALEVISCDISPDAVDWARKNIALNGFDSVMTALCADVFEVLRSYEAQGRRFDLIILDPSAFAKNARSIDRAYGGYKEINLRAMKILSEGGLLVSCSCSHYFDAQRFYSMLAAA